MEVGALPEMNCCHPRGWPSPSFEREQTAAERVPQALLHGGKEQGPRSPPQVDRPAFLAPWRDAATLWGST